MLMQADARSLPLQAESVDCVVTSPPYWGLRDYGNSRQIGLEASPEAYVQTMVSVFGEVWRVLKPTGTCWLNLGDSYAGSGCGYSGSYERERPAWRSGATDNQRNGPQANRNGLMAVNGCKPKDLVGIPWRVAFALQAEGWYLRSDIIWSKPNPMPESVTDRPTKAHEYLFLLTKSERYYYDADAIREPFAEYVEERVRHEAARGMVNRVADNRIRGDAGVMARQAGARVHLLEAGRNKRSVWTIPTMPYAGAHFATMPEALVKPCILAGCPLGGLVLDPFIGSGTVGTVAERLGRRWVGVDLNQAYHELAKVRTAQRGLRFSAADNVSRDGSPLNY